MTGIWQGVRSLAEKLRDGVGSSTEWVEPGNWITRAVITGQLEDVAMPRTAATAPVYDLAPDNVLIATSAPRPVSEEEAATREDGRVARAG